MKKLMTAAIVGMLGLGGAMGEKVNVYLGTQGRGESKGIYLSELDTETGALSAPKLAVEVTGPGFLVLSKDGKSLYSTARAPDRGGERGMDAVAWYGVQEDGMLKLGHYESSQGSGPCFVGLDATGTVLMVANYGSGGVAAYAVKADGSVSPSTSFHQHEGSSVNERRQKGPHAHSIYAGPDNKFVYAPDLGIDKVVIYALDAAGARLKPAGAAAMPPGSGPRHMKFGKDGEQAYVLSELLLTVVVFDRNAKDGNLAQKQVVSVLPDGAPKDGMTCSEILVSPNGKFVYTANRDTAGKGRDSLSVLTVGDGGKLTLLQNVPAKVAIPRNINLSPDGKWLLVAGQKSGNVPVFAVGSDGQLSPTKHEIKVANAMCVVFRKK
jgi:6-phosphogluconolactonase